MIWLACAAPLPVDDAADTAARDRGVIADTDAGGGDSGGHDSGAAFELEARTERTDDAVALRSNLPALADDCEAEAGTDAPCDDVDLDGLTDAWEDLVLDRLRPTLRFDEAEPLVDDDAAVLFAVGRVAPVEHGGVRVFVMNGYSSDYGRCGVSAHDGDSERVVLDLEISGGDASVVGAYTAAHENTEIDHGTLWRGDELQGAEWVDDAGSGEPRWRIYASDGKHASYPTAQACEEAEWVVCVEEDCAPDGVEDETDYDRLPPVVNAGEEDAPRMSDLASIGFPDEDAWAAQDFCGGQGRGGTCSASVREKLLADPFAP